MIVCKVCENDVYLIQRAMKGEALECPYVCWYCDRSLEFDEVTFN